MEKLTANQPDIVKRKPALQLFHCFIGQIPHPSQLSKSTFIRIDFNWVNVNGLQESFGENEMQWFERIREACGGESEIVDAPNHEALKQDHQGALLNFFRRLAKVPVPPVSLIDYKIPIPLSEQIPLYVYNDIREYNQPYFKHGYGTEKLDLSSNGYVNQTKCNNKTFECHSPFVH